MHWSNCCNKPQLFSYWEPYNYPADCVFNLNIHYTPCFSTVFLFNYKKKETAATCEIDLKNREYTGRRQEVQSEKATVIKNLNVNKIAVAAGSPKMIQYFQFIFLPLWFSGEKMSLSTRAGYCLKFLNTDAKTVFSADTKIILCSIPHIEGYNNAFFKCTQINQTCQMHQFTAITHHCA